LSNENGVTAGAQPPVLTKEQVIAISQDKELRALKPGTEQYKAAFEKKFPSKSTKPSTPAGGMNGEQAETKNDAESGNTEASVDDDSGKKTIAKRKAKDRIGELVAEREALRAENEALKKGKTPEAAKPTETPSPSAKFDKPKPKREDFKSDAEFSDAQLDWKIDEREWKRDQEAKAKSAVESVKTKLTKFSEVGKQIEKDLDLEEGSFDLAVNDADFKMFDSTRAYLLDSELGPQIAFDIANDDEVKAKFSKMNPTQQLTYIGKQEAKLEARKQQDNSGNRTTISAAKEPGKPLAKGTSNPTGGIRFAPGTKPDFKAYEAQRRADRKAKGLRP
jgi:hypothetical protein